MYSSETQKIRPTALKYIKDGDVVYDFGCGGDKIVPEAIGVDFPHRLAKRPFIAIKNPNSIYDLDIKPQSADVIYSSHFLEHIMFPAKMIGLWHEMLKKGGFLILYLPDDDKYDNASNPEHLHAWTHRSFVDIFKTAFSPSMLEIVDSKRDFGEDRYSFYLVARKA